ncbi:MAG: PaaI family thioesterase [Candidatus Rokubacteria bacterium]|nr:PaaI family thioesterase [Candidatus Rokubacteria bacterium]
MCSRPRAPAPAPISSGATWASRSRRRGKAGCACGCRSATSSATPPARPCTAASTARSSTRPWAPRSARCTTASEGGVGQTTLDLNVSFLAAPSGSDVFAEGRILKKGRTIAFGEASITDATGRLLAVGRATYLLLAPRA